MLFCTLEFKQLPWNESIWEEQHFFVGFGALWSGMNDLHAEKGKTCQDSKNINAKIAKDMFCLPKIYEHNLVNIL
jgi:hypothetical protein